MTDDGRADAVLALVLTGPTTQDVAVTVVRRLARLADQPAGVLDAIVTWARHLYPGPDPAGAALVTPTPDFLAAALVARCADPDHRHIVAGLDLGATAQGDGQVMVRLVRAAAWFPAAARLVADVLTRYPSVVGAAIEVAALAGVAARRVIGVHLVAAIAAARPSADQLDRLLVMTHGIGLGQVRVALSRLATSDARAAVADGDTDEARADLAGSLHSLGVSLRAVGEHEEALRMAAEAVAWWSRLATMRPAEFADNYQSARAELTRRFAEAGHDPGAALAAEQDATERLPPPTPVDAPTAS